MADDKSIGARIKQLRGKLLTQKELAAAAGVSVDLIRSLEQGKRHTASITYLQRIARALDTDVTTLLGKPTSIPTGDPKSGVIAIRDALTSIDSLIAEIVDYNEALGVEEAARVVRYAWGSYWAGRLEQLGTLLPTGLAQLRATAAVTNRPASYRLLADLYCVTRCTAARLGQPDLAWLAIRNALDAAQLGSDELQDAMLRSSISHQLLTQGRYDESVRVATHAAERIEPDGNAPAPHLSTYGNLLLTGASAAARAERTANANDLVQAAQAVASRIGYDRNDYETTFGPSQVAMQAVDVHVVTEHYTAALAASDRVPHDTRLPAVSRARNLYDRALAHVRLGHHHRALDTLLAAEQLAPDLMRYHTLPRTIVAELLDRERPTRLRDLARRLRLNEPSANLVSD